MARNVGSLDFVQASCCGRHSTAQFSADGAEWCVTRYTDADGGELYKLLVMRDGLLDRIETGLTAEQANAVISQVT